MVLKSAFELLLEEETKSRDIPDLPIRKTVYKQVEVSGCNGNGCSAEALVEDTTAPVETFTLFDVATIADLSQEELCETIHKVIGSYCIAPIHTVREFLINTVPLVPFDLGLECIDILTGDKATLGKGCALLDKQVESKEFSNLYITRQFEYLVLLLSNGYDRHFDTLRNILNDCTIEVQFRFRLLQSAGNRLEGYKNKLYFDFFRRDTNDIMYRILASKSIIEYGETSKLLAQMMNDIHLENNHRADIADTFLHDGTDEQKIVAQSVIEQLGGGGLVYENKENVHFIEAYDKIFDIIMKTPVTDTFDDIKHNFPLKAMERIEFDSTTVQGVNLREFFTHVFAYILNHKYCDSLLERLNEELEDSIETCSSGYFSRLANVFSGFDEEFGGITISWVDQIQSYFFSWMNRKLLTHPDRDVILEQMVNKSYADRRMFSTFLAETLSEAREMLYREFCDYMSDDEWELAFKQAVSNYQD